MTIWNYLLRKTSKRIVDAMLAAEQRQKSTNTARTNVEQARKHRGKLAEKMRKTCGTDAENLRKSCGKPAENLRKTCGKVAENLRKSCGKTCRKLAENLRKSCGKPAEKLRKTCGKDAENLRKTVRNPCETMLISCVIARFLYGIRFFHCFPLFVRPVCLQFFHKQLGIPIDVIHTFFHTLEHCLHRLFPDFGTLSPHVFSTLGSCFRQLDRCFPASFPHLCPLLE